MYYEGPFDRLLVTWWIFEPYIIPYTLLAIVFIVPWLLAPVKVVKTTVTTRRMKDE